MKGNDLKGKNRNAGGQIRNDGRHLTPGKRMRLFLAALVCAVCICAAGAYMGSGTVVYSAETAGCMLRLGNVTVYDATADETVITVPVYAQGGMDLRAYDLTVTYDAKMLQLTGVSLLDGFDGCHSQSEEAFGTVRLAGAADDPNANGITGQIGTLTFLLKERVREDNVRTAVGLTAYEFGFDTKPEEVTVRGGVIVLNKSKTPETPAYSYAYGDVDKDGGVSAADALFVLRYVVKLPADAQTGFQPSDQLCMALADMDGDGEIRASDALLILQTVVRLIDARTYNGALADPAEQLTDVSYPSPVPKTAAAAWNQPEVLDIGDADGDGAYTAQDALLVLCAAREALVTEPEAPVQSDRPAASSGENSSAYVKDGAAVFGDAAAFARADIDGDGELTGKDAQLLTDAVVGMYTNFGYVRPQEERVIYVDSKSYTRDEYCFRTLKEAVRYLNANPPADEEERITVRFAPGTYREHTTLNAPYVTFEAMDAEAEEWPNITYYYGCGRLYYSIGGGRSEADASSASTIISSSAHDFCARHMMFENSYNIYITNEEYSDFSEENYPPLSMRKDNIRKSSYQTQGLALYINADRSTLYDCRIIGRQDTLLMNDSNRVYYENCYIEGTVDFIYGSGIAVFERCTVNSPYGAGHITAASTPDEQPYGFLFSECVLTMVPTTESEAPKEESYSLGRPWNGSAMVTYCNCRMDRHIADKNTPTFDRFVTMNEQYPKESARYAEYQTMDIDGNPIDLNNAAPDYERILTEEDISGFYAPARWLEAKYNRQTKMMEYDGWNPGNYE